MEDFSFDSLDKKVLKKKTLSKMESCLSPRQKIEGTETVRKRIIYLPLHLWRKWVESREEDLYRWEKDSRVVDTGKLLLCSNQYENIKMTLFMDPQKLLRQRQYHREKTSTEWGGIPLPPRVAGKWVVTDSTRTNKINKGVSKHKLNVWFHRSPKPFIANQRTECSW